MQVVPFVPDTVTTLRVIPGYVSTIVLSPDERVVSVAVGNSAAWEVTPNKTGDHLFVKSLAAGTPTNVEVVTDLRHYSFLLQSTVDGDPQAAFRLAFTYEVATPAPPRRDGGSAAKPGGLPYQRRAPRPTADGMGRRRAYPLPVRRHRRPACASTPSTNSATRCWSPRARSTVRWSSTASGRATCCASATPPRRSSAACPGARDERGAERCLSR
ncbi:TrbG/VirB9 family P-type conjugative transfer protein [Sphingomonas sp. MMS24-JH45]